MRFSGKLSVVRESRWDRNTPLVRQLHLRAEQVNGSRIKLGSSVIIGKVVLSLHWVETRTSENPYSRLLEMHDCGRQD